MIQHLHIQNFKCLRDVKVDLGPFTVFIGPNDSGKTSLVEAVQLLGRTTVHQLKQVFVGNRTLDNLVWNKESGRNIHWQVAGTSGSHTYEYSLALTPATTSTGAEDLRVDARKAIEVKKSGEALSAQVSKGDSTASFDFSPDSTALYYAVRKKFEPFVQIADSLSATMKYSLDPQAMRSPFGSVPGAVLSETGDNLIAVLEQVLTGRDASARTKLEYSLHQAIPTIQGIYLPTVDGNGKKALEFTLSGKGEPVTIPADLASDGVILLTAYLALAYSNTPEIICIEEPEDGLHHSRLKMVIDLLRKMSTGEVGNRKRQIIITTHSPLLLNYTEPEEVRIFRRSVEKGTEITPMSKVPDIERLKNDYATGELWFLLGEEGLLKGAPA
jgi:predicted ATPase